MINKEIERRNYVKVNTLLDGTPLTKDNLEEYRKELISVLEKYSYGVTPDIKAQVSGKVVSRDEIAYAGKCTEESIEITIKTDKFSYTFPIKLFVPNAVKNPPMFLHIAFRPVPDRYHPIEDIIDRGYACAVMVYTDIVNDNGFEDFSDGLGACFGVKKPRKPDEWGKIGIWAFAASRVLDYIQNERRDIDGQKAIVIGHSRLGKTAHWCGALDTRFFGVVSNNSGYGGAASSRYNTSKDNEAKIEAFIEYGTYEWFCETFKDYRGEKENFKPYDQTQLLALIAPRYLCVGSAIEDVNADPLGEFLTSYEAGKVWEILGEKGLVCPNRFPKVGDNFIEGNVGYHLRAYRHFLSIEDWRAYMDFFDKKLGK
jgi:hypothetical protein